MNEYMLFVHPSPSTHLLAAGPGTGDWWGAPVYLQTNLLQVGSSIGNTVSLPGTSRVHCDALSVMLSLESGNKWVCCLTRAGGPAALLRDSLEPVSGRGQWCDCAGQYVLY